jgi:hypothetical protein
MSSARDRRIEAEPPDRSDKASLHGQLGLSLTYHPDAGQVNVEARPLSVMYVK